VPAALANGRLLASSAGRWDGQVVARTSMHDLLFTLPGEEYPFENQVRVSWSEGVFDFSLFTEIGLANAHRAGELDAPHVLDAFLDMLVSYS
jgi:hypothetical protein